MKYAAVILEGASDLPCDSLEGRTPLQVARAVHLSRWAERGCLGVSEPIQEGMHSRGEVMLGLLFGLSREQALKLQRAPLEAAAYDISLEGYKSAYRGRFITLQEGRVEDVPLDLSLEETKSLAEALQASWDPTEVKFVATQPGMLLVLCHNEEPQAYGGRPPVYLQGEALKEFTSRAGGQTTFCTIHRLAADLLEGHTVNDVRVDLGQNPVNAICLWGGGATEPLNELKELPRSGAVVSGCPMVKGFAKHFGLKWTSLRSPSEDEGKSGPAFNLAGLVTAVQDHELLVVYCQAAGEVGDHGTPEDKVRAIDRLDQLVLAPLAEYLEAQKPWRLVLISEGLVSSQERLPASGILPVLLMGEGVQSDSIGRWEEAVSQNGKLGVIQPDQLLKKLTEE